MRNSKILVVLFLSGLLFGCGKSDIATVKEGTMPDHKTTTIGAAFDASFDNPKWESRKGKKGEKLVVFTGEISKQLHDSVTAEIKKATLKPLKQGEDVQTFLARRDLFHIAVEKLGGEKNQFLQSLNEKYACTLDQRFLLNVLLWLPVCGDEAAVSKYRNDTVEFFLSEFWKIGDPVEVEWIVEPDGKTFQLNRMAGSSWVGIKHEAILDNIYK